MKTPFTHEEMLLAHRLVMPESEAQEAASFWSLIPKHLMRGRFSSYGLDYETLILLSLVSDDLRAKVEAFLSPHQITSEPWWSQRREEMKRQLKSSGEFPDS